MIGALLCCDFVFAGGSKHPSASAQAMWIANYPGENSFISELSSSQLQRSGIPRESLNTRQSNVGGLGKLAFDGSGNLWVPFCGTPSTVSNGLVAAFSPESLHQFAAGNRRVKPKAELTGASFNCPIALAFDHSGNLWIANAGTSSDNTPSIVQYPAASLFEKTPAPAITLTLNTFQGLRSLAFDTAGNLWVSVQNNQTDGVYQFTPGQLSTSGAPAAALILQSSSFYYPDDIVFDSANNIWISYRAGNLSPSGLGGIQMFAAASLTGSGTIEPAAAVTIGGGPCSVLAICGPAALAFDQGGNLWVAQSYTISEFTPTQLATGNPSLAQVILATNLANGKGIAGSNFAGPAFLTFGPATK